MVWGPFTRDFCSSITPIPHDTSCRPSLRQQCKIDKSETSSIMRYLQGTRSFPSCPTQKMSMRIDLPKVSLLSKAILSRPQQCMQDSVPKAEHAGVARCRPTLASSCQLNDCLTTRSAWSYPLVLHPRHCPFAEGSLLKKNFLISLGGLTGL